MCKIVWGYTAEQDYLSTLNRYSLKLMEAVEKTEYYIAQNPFMGVLIDAYKGVRKIRIMQHYSLIYNVEENIINIIAFWDNRRNPDDLVI